MYGRGAPCVSAGVWALAPEACVPLCGSAAYARAANVGHPPSSTRPSGAGEESGNAAGLFADLTWTPALPVRRSGYVQVELTAGAIPTMWGGAPGTYTVQVIDYKHLKENQYKCDAPLLAHLPGAFPCCALS